ncbi:MAG: MarR family transcriptional regulator [Caldilineaceae bacterium]|nr:MarR family transcriptional regulator [Caldilineaceae bacterium]
MDITAQACAREIIEVVPAIIQAIRVHMRAQRMHDLSVPQFRTLAYIGRHPGCSLSEVAEFIGLTLPSMSVLVNGLVADQLVERATSPFDRRRVTLTLTAEGRLMHSRALEGTMAWLAALVEPISELDRAAIVQALEALRPIFATSAQSTSIEQS